jgi:hypothetical protein
MNHYLPVLREAIANIASVASAVGDKPDPLILTPERLVLASVWAITHPESHINSNQYRWLGLLGLILVPTAGGTPSIYQQNSFSAEAIKILTSLYKKLAEQRAKPLTDGEKRLIRTALCPRVKSMLNNALEEFIDGKPLSEIQELASMAKGLEEKQ